MASLDPGAINDYLSNAQAVLNAGRRLRVQLDAPIAERQFAARRLEEAAAESDAAAGRLRAFMFEEADAPAALTPEHRAEDALALITTDIHIANVLIAAGHVSDESGGGPVPPAVLDEALARLDNANRTLSRAAEQSGAFHFSEDVEPVSSLTLDAALDNFRSCMKNTLDTVVVESEKVARVAVDALGKLPLEKVTAALGGLGTAGDALPRIGRLLRQGIDKLEGALNALLRLFGSDAMRKKFRDGELIPGLLRSALHVDDTMVFVENILHSGKVTQVALDAGSTALTRLTKDFSAKMASARTLSAGAAGATSILLLTPFAPQAALFAASLHAVIIAAVLLMALDYTDSGTLRWVRGVREVAAGTATA
jgi:hypothetical protein